VLPHVGDLVSAATAQNATHIEELASKLQSTVAALGVALFTLLAR
jgi:hypothetical protein